MKKDSIGWLTESALLPTESKKIQIDSSSFVGLKAKILEEKAKLVQQKEKAPRAEQNEQMENKKEIHFKNTTKKEILEARINSVNDINEHQPQEENNFNQETVSFSLFEKAKKYEEKFHDKKFYDDEGLIDFEQKRLQHKDKDEESGSNRNFLKHQNLDQQWDDFIKPSNRTLNKYAEREKAREEWEQQAKEEIDQYGEENLNYVPAEIKGDSASSLLSKMEVAGSGLEKQYIPLVRQKWDNVLNDQEKHKLKEVILDKERHKELQLLAKRKRELDREARKNKVEAVKRLRKE